MTGQGAKNKRLQTSQSLKKHFFYTSFLKKKKNMEIIKEVGTERVYEPEAV